MVCEDTVLFPEGGGQNSDHGELGGRRVMQVLVMMALLSIISNITVTIHKRWIEKETRQSTL